jgi:RHS repeat-associated protein
MKRSRHSLRIALLAGFLATIGSSVAINAQSFAYVSNAGDSTVLAIDTASSTAVATVPLGIGGAVGAAITPEGAVDRTSAANAPEASASAHLALRTAGIFEEPLVATGETSADEDQALLRAIAGYKTQTDRDDFTVFDHFLAEFPHSNWRVALRTNLGLAYYHYGYFSKAIDAWEDAWSAGRGAASREAKALLDRAVGELARMHARLGHADRLAALFDEIGDRPISGPATEFITGAREGLWTMRNNPGVAYLCGPAALKNLLLLRNASAEQLRFLDEYRSGPQGVTLAELARLAEQAKLPFSLVYREKNHPVPTPAIVHWKVSHFAVLLEEVNDRFHVADPTFGTDLWVTRKALESESSGYFLIPSTELSTGLRKINENEASHIRGMGFTTASDASATRPDNDKAMPDNPSCPMCGYNVTEMVVSLTLKDTPVGYAPPKGPPVFVSVTYNQREAGQPAIFSYFNVSPKWTLNWLSYIQDDPTLPGASVTRYVAGGGYVEYQGYSSANGFFYRETTTKVDAFLQRASDTPIIYRRFLPDGTVETYSQSDGATTYPRRIFLTQIADPAGNAVTLNYDNQLRLTSLTDATGRNTSFSYELPDNPLLVTRITDPFDRSAQIAYDTDGRLSQITDIIGLTSRFTYDNSNLVDSMTTPYGTTSFAFGDGTYYGVYRFVEITDPLGNHERVEFLQNAPGIPSEDSFVPVGITPFNYQGSMFMNGRDTYYWDKHVLAVARGDYTKARNRHWLHDSTHPGADMTSSVIESVKNPLERRIWRGYPGQFGVGGGSTGNLDKPSIVARVLDDGSTQSTQFTYNFRGKVTSVIDPVGRVTLYDYDPVHAYDLFDIKQQTSPGVLSTIASFTYNNQHLPLTYTDAAGQTTTYTYNAVGQLTQVTDPLNETTKYVYDPLGYLTQIINANNQIAATFTYDTFGRVATLTDSEGYTLQFAYDAMDRITKITYPDGTTRNYTWNKLDLASVKDRLGRITQYSYDAVRNLVDVADPLGRHTKVAYYENGHLKSLTDPNGNTTTWNVDVQNRVTGKQYADGRQFNNTYEATTSRLKAITDPLGQTKQYTYTEDDQLAGISYSNAVNPTANVTFTYDPYFLRLASMADGSGTTQYQYLPVGALGALKLLSEVGPYQNSAIGYQYDALGRLSRRTVDVSSETFGYDAIGRLISHASPLGTFSLAYLGQTQQPISRILGGGPVATRWMYDTNTNDRRLMHIDNGAEPRNYHLTTNPENLITELDVAGGGTPESWTYSYDAADRLLQATSQDAQYSYSYDPPDNITSLQGPSGVENATYNVVNQITSFNNNSFFYDANGNLTTDGVRTYQWDAENRLIAVSFNNQPAKRTTFRYDGLGRRIGIISSDGTGLVETRYLWCGSALCQARDSNDTVSRRYYPEGEGLPGAPLYYAQDQLGSVRDIVGAQTGQTIASFDYDPYGNPTHISGSTYTDFRYAGLFYEQNSRLYLANRRAYDAATGRWLSRDPLGEAVSSINLYRYVKNDPVNLIDPTGAQEAGEPGWEPGYEPTGDPLLEGLNEQQELQLKGYLYQFWELYYWELLHGEPKQPLVQQCLINPPDSTTAISAPGVPAQNATWPLPLILIPEPPPLPPLGPAYWPIPEPAPTPLPSPSPSLSPSPNASPSPSSGPAIILFRN